MTDYWLTPPELKAELELEFGPMFDPCPYPRAAFDGLEIEWESPAYCNPPFCDISKWQRKAVAEARKGKRVVYVQHFNNGEILLLTTAKELRNIGRVPWGATDGSGSKKMKEVLLCIL